MTERTVGATMLALPAAFSTKRFSPQKTVGRVSICRRCLGSPSSAEGALLLKTVKILGYFQKPKHGLDGCKDARMQAGCVILERNPHAICRARPPIEFQEKMARPGRLELPTLCLEAVRTILPNLARGG
jgi:hypothetical protein